MKKMSLDELESLKPRLNSDGVKTTKDEVILKYKDKTFKLALGDKHHKESYKNYLANVVSPTTRKKLSSKTTQPRYLNLLELFMKDELTKAGIASKSFDVYSVNADSIEALEFLYKIITEKSSPLYKINKNDYRAFKNDKKNPYCDKNFKDYKGGDPAASLAYYIKFLKQTAR